MPKKRIITKKNMYLLLLIIIPLAITSIKTSYSKFTESVTIEQDIVNINTSLNMNINNIKEYKNITVGSNDYEIFDIEVSNNTDEKIFYSLWYKMITPTTINDKIVIAKLTNEENYTEGKLEIFEEKKVTLIIKNNTNNRIKVNIGVSTSKNNIEEIEYIDGREPIIKEDYETNIYYDSITNKYYFSKTNTEVEFKTEPITFNYSNEYQMFTAPYSGYYLVNLWAPSTTEKSGDYLTTNIYLKRNSSIYFYVGRNRSNNIFAETDVRLIAGPWENEDSLNSRILIAGNDINQSYTYSDVLTEGEEQSYKLNTDVIYNLKKLENTIKTSNTNQGDGMATVEYISSQEPTVEGIEYVKLGENYRLEDIACKDNGRGCKLIKVRPSTTENLNVGTYEIVYIVKDDDNITYKYTDTFEIISE